MILRTPTENENGETRRMWWVREPHRASATYQRCGSFWSPHPTNP